MRLSIGLLPLAMTGLLTTPAPAAQDPAPKPVERLTEWPEAADAAELRKEISRLRKARTEAMGVQAAEALRTLGAACVPELLPTLGKEQDEAAVARILSVLEAVTDARHTRLLAAEFGDRSVEVRTFCLDRTALFPDPGIREPAEKALTAATERLKKAKKKPEVRAAQAEQYAAALCVTAAGSLAGLEALADRAEEDWGKYGGRIRPALESVRSPEATAHVAPLLESGERARQLAALNLLGGCGSEEARKLVRPFLDSTDRGLQLACINALRGIVDGDPPLERLPVFEMIERAGKWKERL